jgi:hypothetical protein
MTVYIIRKMNYKNKYDRVFTLLLDHKTIFILRIFVSEKNASILTNEITL